MKFGAGACLGLSVLQAAWPAVLAAARVLAGPWAEAPGPGILLPRLVGVLIALSCLGSLLWDAVFDRLAPRGILAALVADLLLLASVGPLPSPSDGARAIAAALRGVAAQARQELEGAPTLAEGGGVLQRLIEGLPPTSIRDRSFRARSPRLVLLEDREGPVVEVPAGDPPATLYLAVSPSRRVAWLSASNLEGARPAILREDGRPLVIPLLLCPAELPPGGASC